MNITAKDGKLFYSGKRIGQLIIPTFEDTPPELIQTPPKFTVQELINRNIITKEKFAELLKKEPQKLLFFPLYSKNLAKNNFINKVTEGTPIDFDFIQIEGKCLIYADGNEVKIIGKIDEKAKYYLMSRGIILDETLLQNVNIENISSSDTRVFIAELCNKLGFKVEFNKEVKIKDEKKEYIITCDGDICYDIISNINIEKLKQKGLLRGLILNDKLYGAEFESGTLLDIVRNSIYFDKLKVVGDISLTSGRVFTGLRESRVKFRPGVVSYKILKFDREKKTTFILYLLENGKKILREEPLKLVKPVKGVKLTSPNDITEKIMRFIEVNNFTHYFNRSGSVLYKVVGNILYYIGSGNIRIDCVVDKKNKLLYLKSYDRIVEVRVIDSTNLVEKLVEFDNKNYRRKGERVQTPSASSGRKDVEGNLSGN